MSKEQGDKALLLLEDLLDSGISVEQCIKDLASYFRALLLIKRKITNESILGLQVGSISPEIIEKYNEEQLEAALHYFLQLYKDVRYSISPRFELELAVSKLINLHNMSSSASLVRQIKALKNNLTDSSELPPVVLSHKTTPPKVKEEHKEVPKVIERVEKVEKIEPVQTKSVEIERKEINQQMLSSLIQTMAQQRDNAGLLLHQVVELEDKGDSLRLVFSSQYALDSAKQQHLHFSQLFFEQCGFKGEILFEIEEQKVESVKEDEVAQTIATMFRGDIISS